MKKIILTSAFIAVMIMSTSCNAFGFKGKVSFGPLVCEFEAEHVPECLQSVFIGEKKYICNTVTLKCEEVQ